MILELLLGTIAATMPAPVVRPAPPPADAARPARVRTLCRTEFGTSSLVQRYRVCHAATEWRVIDARRQMRRRQGT